MSSSNRIAPLDPLVSVIVPAYNAATFIADTLKSVMAQTYQNLEIIVVDDGSCDRTVEIVQQLAQGDQRIRLIQQPNGGVAAARNLAIRASQGELVAPIDADDIWYPDQIRRQVQVMQAGGDRVGLVYSWSVDIDEQGQPLGGFHSAQVRGNVHTTLIAHNFIGNASATMMRRSCLDRVGGYDPELRNQQAQGCEDWDLYLRIAEHYEFGVVPEFLVGYRKLSTSMSCDYSTMAKSHELIMAAAQHRCPQVSSYLFNLSSSNLYMYFAHQSHRYQKHDVTRFWLQQALAANRLSPLIRPGFYSLYWASRGVDQVQQSQNKLRSQSKPHTALPQQLSESGFSAPQWQLWLTIAVNQLFHWVVTWLMGGSNVQQMDTPPRSVVAVDK